MPRGDDIAPLQRKRKRPRISQTTSTVARTSTPSVFSGVPHRVEGRDPVQQRRMTVKGRTATKAEGIRGGFSHLDTIREKATKIKQAKAFNKAEALKFEGIQTQRTAEDAARGRIKEIPDIEAGEAARRKRAARRRMRGRMGTILSDRPQALGATGKIG